MGDQTFERILEAHRQTRQLFANAIGYYRYPADWPEIAQRIKDRAGWRCQHCGHPHEPESGHTLTVHHLDMDPANCADDNLVALCQKCHLHIQATYQPGQLTLPGIEVPA